jgi:hypothetical protein
MTVVGRTTPLIGLLGALVVGPGLMACDPIAGPVSFEPLPTFRTIGSARPGGNEPPGGGQQLFYLDVLVGGYSSLRFAYELTPNPCVTEPDPGACRTATEEALHSAETLEQELISRDAELAQLLSEKEFVEKTGFDESEPAFRAALRRLIEAFAGRLEALGEGSDAAIAAAEAEVAAAVAAINAAVRRLAEAPIGLQMEEL